LEGTLFITLGVVAAYLSFGLYRDRRVRSTPGAPDAPTDV
jgi:hypothetical protein